MSDRAASTFWPPTVVGALGGILGGIAAGWFATVCVLRLRGLALIAFIAMGSIWGAALSWCLARLACGLYRLFARLFSRRRE